MEPVLTRGGERSSLLKEARRPNSLLTLLSFPYIPLDPRSLRPLPQYQSLLYRAPTVDEALALLNHRVFALALGSPSSLIALVMPRKLTCLEKTLPFLKTTKFDTLLKRVYLFSLPARHLGDIPKVLTKDAVLLGEGDLIVAPPSEVTLCLIETARKREEVPPEEVENLKASGKNFSLLGRYTLTLTFIRPPQGLPFFHPLSREEVARLREALENTASQSRSD